MALDMGIHTLYESGRRRGANNGNEFQVMLARRFPRTVCECVRVEMIIGCAHNCLVLWICACKLHGSVSEGFAFV